MNLYSNTPKPKNNAGKAVAVILLICGFLLFVFSGREAAVYATVIQLIGLLLLTFAIYIAAVYLLREFCIVLERNETDESESLHQRELYDFVIYESKGKRQVKVCHLAGSELTGVRVVDKENRQAVKTERKKKKSFRYNAEFCPVKELEILAVYEDEEYSILIGYDMELKAILERMLAEG